MSILTSLNSIVVSQGSAPKRAPIGIKSATIGAAAFNLLYLAAAEIVVLAIFGAASAVIFLLVGIPLATASIVWEMRLYRSKREAMESRAIISSLSLIYSSIKYNGKPVLYSFGKAAGALNPSATPVAYNAISEIADRMRLGQDMDDAIQVLKQSGSWPFLAPLYEFGGDYRDGMEPVVSLKAIIDNYHASGRAEAERSISRVQRQVTVSMALGTIVPSFLMFVFVGYSIVYYSTFQYLVFAISMLLVLPCAYSVLRASVAGHYETR